MHALPQCQPTIRQGLRLSVDIVAKPTNVPTLYTPARLAKAYILARLAEGSNHVSLPHHQAEPQDDKAPDRQALGQAVAGLCPCAGQAGVLAG
jgi:hypothetical protein